jgi:hypothetical protein
VHRGKLKNKDMMQRARTWCTGFGVIDKGLPGPELGVCCVNPPNKVSVLDVTGLRINGLCTALNLARRRQGSLAVLVEGEKVSAVVYSRI